MNQSIILLTVLAYLLSMGLYVQYLYTGKEWTGRLATLLMFLGLVAHYVALLLRARGTHTVPYHDLQGSMSLFGWLLAVTYLCLEIYHRQRTVGAFVMPVILAFFFARVRPSLGGSTSQGTQAPFQSETAVPEAAICSRNRSPRGVFHSVEEVATHPRGRSRARREVPPR